ncbi:hypothetical protein [Mitsuokella sp.]|uniref:hypothetical protein n=1 Tax=unclassified Mitsuokella TaxID=2637239 RepID=UPI003D7CF539
MKRRKGFIAILILVLVAIGVSGYCYQSARTPEYALDQLMEGVKEHDESKVQRYADLSSIVTTSYDMSTEILARDIGVLQKEYPEDWFFRHDTAFMKKYIAERRNDDIVFINRSLEFFLNPSLTPIGENDQKAQWLAGEADKFTQHYTAKLDNVERKGDWAEATFTIKGDDSDYGRLVPEMTVKAELMQHEDGHFQVMRISNIEEMFPPVVKGIEDYWTLQGWQ